MSDMWRARDQALADEDLIELVAEARDGPVGIIRAAGYQGASNYLVVDAIKPGTDTPVPIIVPRGLVESIDWDREAVVLAATRQAVFDAPAYDADREGDPGSIETVGQYWGDNADGVMS
jgi:hypothetical protein